MTIDLVCIAGAAVCIVALAAIFAIELRRAVIDYRQHSLLPRPVHRAARRTGLH